ncbi:MAG: hypothetical protein V4501_07605 [Pseudomonadota bacterium]
MGHGSFRSDDWDTFRSVNSIDTLSIEETFRPSISTDFDPSIIKKLRESCETSDKPKVTPIIIALDVTGSMGKIPDSLIKGGLGKLMASILARASIPNPHVMFMAIGDVNCDSAPLQVTQFEADIRIANQLKDLYLEGGGGGNGSESYPLAWYFAATRTKLDSFNNRGEKGILFTIGDDDVPLKINASHIRRFLGEPDARDVVTRDILSKVQKTYDVFHLGIKQGNSYTPTVQSSWANLLGERLITVQDYSKVDEIIVSTIDSLIAQRQKLQDNIRNHMASRVAVLSGRSQVAAPVPMQIDGDALPPSYTQATGIAVRRGSR